MLSIILFVLKLIGIILLILLNLLLLILGLVLFAPIKYKGSGVKDSETLKVYAWITYLNPIIRVLIQYPGLHIVQVKICGFVVFKTGKTSEEEEKDENIQETTKEKEIPSFKNNSVVEQECRQEQSKQENANPQQCSSDSAREQTVSTDYSAEEKNGTAKEETTAAEESSESLSGSNEQSSPSKDNIFDTARYYISLFQENKGLILDVLKIVFRALQTILPRKCRVKAVFGTGEADKTGFIYAAYCALEGYLPGEVTFEPVWTEKFAEGEFEVTGKIRIIHFVAAVIKIIANPKVRLLIKKIRRV